MEVGNVNNKHFVLALKVKSVLDPCGDENDESQDCEPSLGTELAQGAEASDGESEVDDILETSLERQFQLVVDKGNLDAIGLHPDGAAKRIMYWDSVAKLVASGGLLDELVQKRRISIKDGLRQCRIPTRPRTKKPLWNLHFSTSITFEHTQRSCSVDLWGHVLLPLHSSGIETTQSSTSSKVFTFSSAYRYRCALVRECCRLICLSDSRFLSSLYMEPWTLPLHSKRNH